MSSFRSQMQAMSLEERHEVSQQRDSDKSKTGAEPHAQTELSHQSKDDLQVSPYPLPPLEECLEAKRAKHCMYFGFYAGRDGVQKALISSFPEEFGNRYPDDISILWPALLYLRAITKCDELELHVGVVSQRVKDQILSIQEPVGASVLVLGLFPLDREAFERRITQEGANKISKLFGTPPTWWRISQVTEGE
ncbi:hypothetical protein BD309DRAFT_966307 [Dichomitus squalens]|uniref:Uncharacterized protein n=1 Tax=Dichomitus squalens TaxID=114155 RepID=A0A4Q9PHS0_9APHY|nr:hypothetical protein BD311DRAFT_762607 [Dichomitus squalens]TBU40960.1 hypothetical protein BD309DRAFT_966307 [Dichomitus squalens]TBU53281.1 hypothetical protein BD310DRAFT_938455 [Dichomitus squalens]